MVENAISITLFATARIPQNHPMPTSDPRRVQLMIQGDLEYFRDVVLGARHHAFETGRLCFVDRWLPHELAGRPLRELVRRDRVDGIIAAINTPTDARRLAAAGVPVVNVSNSRHGPGLPLVTQDDEAVGRLAAEHLLACGCRSFLFWGHAHQPYSDQRRAGFIAALAAAGVARAEILEGGETGEVDARGFAAIRRALARLLRPAGLFGAQDSLALALLRAARAAGWTVPEDAAVLGAGDDDFAVDFEAVPLSSIRLPARRIGQAAAELMESLLAGRSKTPAPARLRLDGARLVPRKSTETIACADPLVTRALRHIRAHPEAHAADVARVCGVARSGLQRRCLAALGRGLKAEVQRVRLARAEALLGGGDAKLAAVAAQAGYPSVQRLCAAFRAAHGCTPGAYRTGHRSRR